jgi:hypothetical protein
LVQRTGFAAATPPLSATAKVKEIQEKDGHLYLVAALPQEITALGSAAEIFPFGGGVFDARVLGPRHGVAAITQVEGNEGSVHVRLVGAELPTAPITVRVEVGSLGTYRPFRRAAKVANLEIGGAAEAPRATAASAAFYNALSERYGRVAEQSPGGLSSYDFAAARAQVLSGAVSADPAADTGRSRRGELGDMMALYTGVTSIEEALQADRGLMIRGAAKDAETVPLASVQGVALAVHPWDEIIAATGREPKIEPMAKIAPAAMFYLHFRDLRVASQTSALMAEWLQPMAELAEGKGGSSKVAERLEQQLALERTVLSEKLGHLASSGVVVLAGDPFVREGTDVAIVFQLAHGDLLRSSLDGFAAAAKTRRPDATSTQYEVEGVTVTLLSTADRAIHQHRFELDDKLYLSNSRPTVERLLRTAKGKEGSLAESADFRAFRAEFPHDEAEDGFVFISDAFVAHAVSPRTKILAARRMQARADLLAVAHGALLYGALEGKAPKSASDLVASGFVRAEELTHADGSPIEYHPERGPSSARWGTLTAMRPLAEETLEQITLDEKSAYENFRETYQTYWRSFIDPVGIRIERSDDGKTLELDAKMMPLISGSDYDELIEAAGEQRLTRNKGLQGVVWTLGVGKTARLRQELDGLAQALGNKDLGFGWLGQWVAMGATDRSGLWDLAMATDEVPQPERPEGAEPNPEVVWKAGARLPVWVAAHVGNPLALGATLTAIKAMATAAAPDLLEWGDGGKHRDVSIVKVAAKSGSGFMPGAEHFALYYASPRDVFVASLDRDTLTMVIDAVMDDRMPKGAPETAKVGPQVVLEVAPTAASWLGKTIAALLEQESRRAFVAALHNAQLLVDGLRIDPASDDFSRVALAHLGYVPSSPHRGQFKRATDGRVEHSIYGSAAVPNFPQILVEGSPISKLFAELSALSFALSFEGSGNTRALRANASWQRR